MTTTVVQYCKSLQILALKRSISFRSISSQENRSLLKNKDELSFPRSIQSLHTRKFSSSTQNLFSPATDYFSTTNFEQLGLRSSTLRQRLTTQLGFDHPTSVQAATFGIFSRTDKLDDAQLIHSSRDMTIGAETGSGKTFAYLLPLMDDILEHKRQAAAAGDAVLVPYDYARALILVPNKELVQQVVRMAKPLAGGEKAIVASPPGGDPSIIRLAVMPGGMKELRDFAPFRNSVGLGGKEPPVDLIVSTPGSVAPLCQSPKNIDFFVDVETVVFDEADMLLDGGYRRAMESVLMGFRRADRVCRDTWNDEDKPVIKTQHVFVAATLPDFGLRSVEAYLQKKFPRAERVTMANMHQARHSGLAKQTEWLSVGGKKERLQYFINLLQVPIPKGGLQGEERVIVFLNSVDDVDEVCQALERVGITGLGYHAKKSLQERADALENFRKKPALEAPNLLVSTDLASRGLDVPGVSCVVQLQFAGNVVAHLHRMGRCGRAGQRTGRGIVFYDEDDEGALVDVIRQAEKQQGLKMELKGADVERMDEAEPDMIEKSVPVGSVQRAFSRRRGFTRKLKKQREATHPDN